MIREKKYDQRRIGCNLLFFKHDSIKCCIDATEDEDGYGRLINHSVANANLQMKIFVFDKIPHVIFTASKEISFARKFYIIMVKAVKRIFRNMETERLDYF